jgi:hypothetical protein
MSHIGYNTGPRNEANGFVGLNALSQVKTNVTLVAGTSTALSAEVIDEPDILVYERDTNKLRVTDGVTAVGSLPSVTLS